MWEPTEHCFLSSQNLLCQLATEEEDSATYVLLKHMGLPPKEYNLKVLRKMVWLLVEEVGESCSSLADPNQRCSCDSVLAASVACVPLVTCPETAPLIGALLQRPVTCDKAALSQDFLDAVSCAYSRKCVSLEAQAVVSLWCHSLASLEGAVMSLLDSPKACSQHGSIFLIVNDIFRSMLVQVEGNQTECVSLKAFFPHTPQSLLAPLLTHPSDMAQEAWPEHLAWVTASLQRLTEEEEEEEGNRGQCGVFEAWFLLVQCANWVEVASQLLVSARPQDCGPLLWLLTFYHHPTNQGHHRTQQLVAARAVWDHLRSLFLLSAPPLPADQLQLLVELMSAVPQQPSLDSLLVASLLVNFAVFSHNPLSGAREIVHMVVQQSGLVREAVCVLNMVELRLNRERSSCSLTDRVKPRTRALHDTLTHMAQHDTHTHTHGTT
ncbi:unnamed protein product [Coregonus sp. 'balchen']|nr:unnamed protein product [Coregonus sp. 'balchen']